MVEVLKKRLAFLVTRKHKKVALGHKRNKLVGSGGEENTPQAWSFCRPPEGKKKAGATKER